MDWNTFQEIMNNWMGKIWLDLKTKIFFVRRNFFFRFQIDEFFLDLTERDALPRSVLTIDAGLAIAR